VEFSLKIILLSLVFYFVLHVHIFHLLVFIFSPSHSFVGPINVVGPRHSASSA
jgi:hypothetical protein